MDQRFPEHIKNGILRIKTKKDVFETFRIIKEKGLHTVCSSSRCPNLNLCFSNKTATFLLLGDKCTRQCPFCNIGFEEKPPVDQLEPEKIAYAVKSLKLNHTVITMVTRDDLDDGGAALVAQTVRSIRQATNCRTIEVLTSDFKGNKDSITKVLDSGIDIFGHNLETVERLYSVIRPGSSYKMSLNILKEVKEIKPAIMTKSGIMVGFGERKKEVFQAIDDLANSSIDFITIGQYLRPSVSNTEVKEYLPLDTFLEYRKYAGRIGIKHIVSAPLVRSSFGAEKFYNKVNHDRGI